MHRNRLTQALVATCVSIWLSACGGGHDEPPSGGTSGTSAETAQSAGANGVVIADDGARAQAAILSTTRAVVALGSASQTVNCAGGGTALFTATAGTSGNLLNGLLDTGEVYTLQFNNCRSAPGSSSVTGALTLTVNSASGQDLSVSTSTQAVVVTLPQRSITFNGSSTLSHTVISSSSGQVITDRWVSPLLSMVSVRNGMATSLTLSQVDFTRSVTTDSSGAVTGSSNQGSLTLGYVGLLGTWSATIATQGVVSFNADGVPLQGLWLITLPRDLITLQVAAGLATLALDFGHNGSIDRNYIWPVLTFTGAAG